MSSPSPTKPPTKGTSGRRVALLALIVLVVTVVPGVVVPTLLCRPAPPHLDDFGVVPAFTLTDDTGAMVTEAALLGHPTIVNFIFTRCDTVCPLTSFKMQTIQTNTSDRRGDGIKLMSISVDPTYDTPEVLAAYAERYQADGKRWRFVTGQLDTIRPLVEGAFMTSMENRGITNTGAPDIVHGQKFMLVDGDLHIRGIYDSNEPTELDAMTRAARYLLRTQR